MGIWGELGVRGNDIRGSEQAVEIMMAGDVVLLRDIFRPEVAETMDFHPEGMGTFRNFLADPTEADQADPFVEQFIAGQAGPFPLAGGLDGGVEIFCQRQKQRKRMFGDRVVVHARGEKHGDFHLLSDWQGDLIEPDTVFGNNFELRCAFHQNLTGDRIVPAEKRVKPLFCKLQHAHFGKRTPLADDLPTLGCHEFVVRAWGVLITASGEKNFHVRKFKIATGQLSIEEVDPWKFTLNNGI